MTVMGRITSRYLPRTYTSRSTSSAMPQMKLLTFNALTSDSRLTSLTRR